MTGFDRHPDIRDRIEELKDADLSPDEQRVVQSIEEATEGFEEVLERLEGAEGADTGPIEQLREIAPQWLKIEDTHHDPRYVPLNEETTFEADNDEWTFANAETMVHPDRPPKADSWYFCDATVVSPTTVFEQSGVEL